MSCYAWKIGWVTYERVLTPYFYWHIKKPTDRRNEFTYGQIVWNYRPQKDKLHRTRLVTGGNLISFPEYISTKTEEITTTKIFFNNTISTKGARFLCCDIKKFYLWTQMARYEYIQLSLKLLSR